jgi:hypothetical protein
VSQLDREQLIEEMASGRAASFQRFADGTEIDFRSGEPGPWGNMSTDFQDMAGAGIDAAEIRAYAAECADALIAEDAELIQQMRARG